MHSSNADETEKQISMDLMTGIIDEGYKLYFVLGEHDDRTNAYVDKMEKNKIHVLDGEAEKITIGDTDLTFYGISNAFFSPSFDLTNEFDIDKSTYNILLAHIPMYSDYEKFGADLTLCGDTHGGIIQIPFLGPAYYNGKFVPELYEDKNKIFIIMSESSYDGSFDADMNYYIYVINKENNKNLYKGKIKEKNIENIDFGILKKEEI